MALVYEKLRVGRRFLRNPPSGGVLKRSMPRPGDQSARVVKPCPVGRRRSGDISRAGLACLDWDVVLDETFVVLGADDVRAVTVEL